MPENNRANIITARELRILPFKPPEDRLSCGIAWKEWLEEAERQFRFFESPKDMKSALLIYGGQELTRLETYLPEPDGTLDEYQAVKKKTEQILCS